MADESVPLLWGGFRMTADVDAGTGTPEGVRLRPGRLVRGLRPLRRGRQVHFTFARADDSSNWPPTGTLRAGATRSAVLYAVGEGGAPGRMALPVDGDEVDDITVEGTLPLALQHGGAGLRLGHDSRVPGLPPLPAARSLHRHGAPLRIESPGRPRPTRRTRSGPRCTWTERVALAPAGAAGLRQA